MGGTSSTASFLVKGVRTFTLFGVLFVVLSSGVQAKTTSRRQAKVSKNSSAVPQGWILGVSSWDEELELTRSSDGSKFDLASSLFSILAGRQWFLGKSNSLWKKRVDVEAFYGHNTTESKSPGLTYFKGGATMYGAAFGIGGAYRFYPKAWVASTLEVVWRQTDYEEPAGYSFDSEDKQKISYLLKFEIGFPVSKKVSIIQQLGANLLERSHTWFLGVRF